MEERRLKNILAHISPVSRVFAAEREVADKRSLPIAVLDELRLPLRSSQDFEFPDEFRDSVRAGHKSEAISSSNSHKERRLSLQDKSMSGIHLPSSSNSGDAGNLLFKQIRGRSRQDNLMPASYSGKISSHSKTCASQVANELHSFRNSGIISSELFIQRCSGVERSRINVGDCEYRLAREDGACSLETRMSKGDDPGDDGKVTGLAALKLETCSKTRDRNRQSFEVHTHFPCIYREAHAMSDRGCINSNVGVPHQEAYKREEYAIGHTVQRAEDDKDTEVLQAERDGQTREFSGEGTGNKHKSEVDNQRRDATTPGILKNLVKQNLQAIVSEPSRPNLQALNFGSEASQGMQVSRNNTMTGQRRIMAEDCIFCLIVQGRSPAFKLYEDEMCVCILDMHPLSHGHALIIPKTHFPSLAFTPPEVAAAMCAVVPVISIAIMEATNCESFNLLVNSGTAAGQVVFHTHFHIIPRRLGDNLWRSEDAAGRTPLSLGHETSLLVQQIHHKLSGQRI